MRDLNLKNEAESLWKTLKVCVPKLYNDFLDMTLKIQGQN
jgi:hypothetical protein